MAKQRNGSQLVGIALLLVVNVVWVLSAEVTRYLFVDLRFQRPLFTTYVKSCMFSVFLLRYLICGSQRNNPSPEKNYSKLERNQSDDEESFENESLTTAEFERIALPSDLESETELERKGNQLLREEKKRKVRFSLVREVRRLPERIALEAKLARLPYRPSPLHCEFPLNSVIRYAFCFAPLWLMSSATYQGALVFTSVSTVNLISASTPLFVLLFGALCSSHLSDRLSFGKFVLVIMNFGGVALISQFSTVFIGAVLSLISAVTYALYLVIFSVFSRRSESMDMNLMFGTIGLCSVIFCTPLMVIIHETGVESQFPLPTQRELLLVIGNGLIGSILCDYLWLYASLLTSSLLSSLSLSLTIPLSLIADAFLRNKTPDAAQLIAAIPIMTSFIGASFVADRSSADSASDVPSGGTFRMSAPKRRVTEVGGDEAAKLMDDADDRIEV